MELGESPLSEIPKDWGLDERKRKDGRIDLIGKQADGNEYIARTTVGGGVGESDLQALARGDHKRTTPKAFVDGFIRSADETKAAHEAATFEAFQEPAEELAHIVTCSKERTVGLSDAYQRGANYWGVPVGEYADMWRAIEFDDYLEDRKRRQ